MAQYNYEHEVGPLPEVSQVYTALQNGADGTTKLPCKAIMVGTTGNYTFTNDDTSTQVVTLNLNTMYYISVRVALSAAAGTVWYWY